MRWEKKKIDGEKSPTTRFMRTEGSTIRSPDTSSKNPPTYKSEKISSLKELLQQIKDVSKEQLNEILLEAQKTGKFIGEILEERGLVSNDTLLSLLIKQCKIPLVSLLSYSIDREIIKIIPPEICEKYKVLPIDKMGNTITLAMVNPMDVEAIETAKKYCVNHQIRPILCSYKEFEHVKRRYISPKEQEIKYIRDDTKATKESSKETVLTHQKQDVEEESIPEAIIVDMDTFDPVIDEKVRKEHALIHTVFTESIAEDTVLKKIETKEKDLTIHDLAASMISSLQGSYELLIRKIKLFHGLSTEEIANIFAHCKQVNLSEGEILFKKGEIGKSLYVLVSGEVEIFDDERHICFLTPGEMLGEMSVITQNERSASARAVKDSILMELNLNIIYRFIPSIVVIKLLTNIIFTLSERLTSITSRLQQLPSDE